MLLVLVITMKLNVIGPAVHPEDHNMNWGHTYFPVIFSSTLAVTLNIETFHTASASPPTIDYIIKRKVRQETKAQET